MHCNTRCQNRPAPASPRKYSSPHVQETAPLYISLVKIDQEQRNYIVIPHLSGRNFLGLAITCARLDFKSPRSPRNVPLEALSLFSNICNVMPERRREFSSLIRNRGA